ncbi:hypothetical protein [Actinoplanes couchii]|uniref:Uncharacterized protein n=1 Tax=Actinoplanes couchii TaxID=403638 RepID=A0ABQ3XEZ9_9ACTN|nr:hypothetical protein [Actinoplanes couchii]MDR6321964.1 hypothetical protein [Actinoplanes couchii]GID57079.1 hypothetical protein Aco03nite_054830 [Actinoplanes couchii]
MSLLNIEPHAPVSYADQIDRAGDDSRAISDYITKNATDGTGGELFGIAVDGNRSPSPRSREASTG